MDGEVVPGLGKRQSALNKEFKEDIDALERSKKALNKQLKSLFSGQITVNFMLEIMWKMITIHPEIGQYLPAPDMNQVLSGKMNNLFYVLCVHIVGIHRSRIIFLDDTERVKLENSTDYQKELMDEGEDVEFVDEIEDVDDSVDFIDDVRIACELFIQVFFAAFFHSVFPSSYCPMRT